MAGKIRHLLLRDGRYYARWIVPKALRDIFQKNELRTPLGSDRREAIEQLPFALVKINSLIDHARDALQALAQFSHVVGDSGAGQCGAEALWADSVEKVQRTRLWRQYSRRAGKEIPARDDLLERFATRRPLAA